AGHREGEFHLHPAKMDAATLVAFGQNEDVAAEPFIPFHIGWFRAPRALSAAFHVYVDRPEVASPSGALVPNDFALYDGDGEVVAEARDMSCKRIRHPELVTRLVEDVRDGPPGPVPARPPGVAVDQAAEISGHLRTMVAEHLSCDPAAVRTDAGFYDLGL